MLFNIFIFDIFFLLFAEESDGNHHRSDPGVQFSTKPVQGKLLLLTNGRIFSHKYDQPIAELSDT